MILTQGGGPERDWVFDPFEPTPDGDLTRWEEDGELYVFGRGSIDDKHSVLGILEALQYKVRKGEQPQRTFYLAFGHDEEVSGNAGAAKLSEELGKKLEVKNF